MAELLASYKFNKDGENIKNEVDNGVNPATIEQPEGYDSIKSGGLFGNYLHIPIPDEDVQIVDIPKMLLKAPVLDELKDGYSVSFWVNFEEIHKTPLESLFYWEDRSLEAGITVI